MCFFRNRKLEKETEKPETSSPENKSVTINEKDEKTDDGKLKVKESSSNKNKEFRDSYKNFEPVNPEVTKDGKLDSGDNKPDSSESDGVKEKSHPKDEDGREM